MDPRTLVADVDHFKQERVESDLGTGRSEDRLVGARRAGGDDDTVEIVVADELHHRVLPG